MEIAVLALGCFWGPEKKFGKIEGITATEVGYCGGKIPNVTYKEVCSGETDHAEVVKLTFDPNKISFEKIIEYFFEFHDPTTLNRQGPDVGTQYRSAVFFHNENQKKIAIETKIALDNSGKYQSEIVTEIIEAPKFYRAEEFHQEYLYKRGKGSCGI